MESILESVLGASGGVYSHSRPYGNCSTISGNKYGYDGSAALTAPALPTVLMFRIKTKVLLKAMGLQC